MHTSKIIKYFSVLLCCSILFGCKKSEVPNEVKPVAIQGLSAPRAQLLKQLTTELLFLGRNNDFVQIAFNECKKQKFGDYYVRIEELFNSKEIVNVVSDKAKSSILQIVSNLKKGESRNPILFYPSVETKEKLTGRINFRTVDEEEPIGVINAGGGGSYTNDEYPGYRFNTDGTLDYAMQITEEFAWSNDVWVIGEEENCSDENMVSAINDDGNPNGRIQGQSEYGGLIQVTDLGAIESWINGKLEFKMTVMNSAGTIVSGPIAFGKWKRDNFKNQKWKDFGVFIGNWNTSTFGNWMYEHWLEEDGGASSSIIITVPPPAGTSGPTVSITIPSKNQDDNLGQATIQFTDPVTTVYSISYANIKRRN